MDKVIKVDAGALRSVLEVLVLVDTPHRVRELQALINFPDSPIMSLVRSYNEQIKEAAND